MMIFERNKKRIAKLLITAFILMCLPLASVPVYAAPEDETGGMSSGPGQSAADNRPVADSTNTAAEIPYSVSRDKAPAYEANKGLSEWGSRKTIKAPENTYVLTAATGASAGDSVLYFAIKYKGKDGVARSQYVFPGIDASSRSAALLNYYAKGADLTGTFGKKALAEINYKETEVTEKTLGAWTVQDFAFRTESEISEIESIDVYLAKGQWTVQGLSLYKMDNYKGYEEYGLVTGQTFLDFEGSLIADLKKKQQGTLTLSSGTVDSVIRLGGQTSQYFDVQRYAVGTEKKSFASGTDVYSFRMDFADIEGAGLEALLNRKALKLSDTGLGIVEDISLEIQYRDRHGWTRKVTLPVILSAYIMARKAAGNSTIMGFGQRGDTIAFQAQLPDFQSIVSEITIKMGNEARTSVEAKGISIDKTTSAMNDTLSGLSKDEVRIAGVSLYKGGCMPYVAGGTDTKGQHLEGATLDYVFETESTGPIMYYSAGDERGTQVAANGITKISLRGYSTGASLVYTANGQGKFLVTLYTSTNKNSGTTSEITVRFHYNDLNGNPERTLNYRVRSSAESFMGLWPATDGGSYIAEKGLDTGGKISFLMEAKDASEFTNVDITLSGGSHWNMSNITIAYVEKYNRRLAYIAPADITGTKYWLERGIVSAEVFNLAKTNPTISDDKGEEIDSDGTKADGKTVLIDEKNQVVTDSKGDPVYVDKTDKDKAKSDYLINGSQLFEGDSTYNIDFGKGSVSEDKRDVDYSSVRHTMTYEQTQLNWKFFEAEKTYDITVNVAKDSDVDLGNGDAGSKNYFYFQLVFQNGNSGYVQANQQLAGDAFRSGQSETFSIQTNRDYGDILSIRILPEDLASDSEPFDKLNIDSIVISERNDGGTYLSYVVDKVGWIGIDYRDEAEKSSARGMRARMANEIAKVYEVSYKQRAVKLLCEISTLPWDGATNQFEGSIIAKVDYMNSDGQAKEIEFDVVQYMAAYMRKSAKSMETITNPKEQTVPTAGNGTVSDPKTMLRPGTTDRFIMPAITDLKSIKAITFTCQTKNNQDAYWNIGKVTISQVIKDGPLELTASGEYYRNMETQRLCQNEEDKVFSKYFISGIPSSMDTITFTENQLVWTSSVWATPVARIPESKNDTVNIFVYPTVRGSNSRQSSFFTNETPAAHGQEPPVKTINANLKYSIPYSKMMATSCDLELAYDAAGNPMFYATDIVANDMVSAGNLTIRALSGDITFDKAIVQHVKQNVVMSTSTYNLLNATALMGIAAYPQGSNIMLDDTEEQLMISFGSGTPTQTLQSEQRDIAVAIIYNSSLDGGTKEYQSPYIYLTDAGYTSLYEGLMAKVNFRIPYVRRIVGYRIGTYGNLQGTVNASAAVVNQVTTTKPEGINTEPVEEKTFRAYASFMEEYPLTESLIRKDVTSSEMWGQNSVTPIAITFTSKEALKTMDGTRNAAVRMVFRYGDYTEASRTRFFSDMTKYIQGNNRSFNVDSPQTVEFFLAEMNNTMGISSLEIVPYDPAVELVLPGETEPVGGFDMGTDALVTQMREGSGIFADGAELELQQKLTAARSAAWTISKAEYDAGFRRNLVTRDAVQTFLGLDNGGSLRLNSVSLTTYVTRNGIAEGLIKDHVKQMVAKGEEVIGGTVTVRDSQSGFRARAYKMVGDAGIDVTGELLTVNDAARSFSFAVPKNNSGSVLIYKIEISPVEAEDLVDRIFITVENEGIGIETKLSLNGKADILVVDHTNIMSGQSGDVLSVKTRVINSTAGITVWVYRMIDGVGTPVTQATVSNLTADGFSFTAPENTGEEIEQYKIEIAPTDDLTIKDTVYFSVAPPPKEEEQTENPPEGSTDKPAEGSTDKPAEGSTDKPAG